MEIYHERKNSFEQSLSKNRRIDRLYSAFRLTAITIAAFLFYLGLSREDWNFIWISLTLFTIFILLLFKHNDVRALSRKLKAYIKVNEDELRYLNGDLSPFPQGDEFIDPEHFYTYDLDIFGRHSLFQHLNRSATQEGKKLLVEILQSQKAADIIQWQESVKELAEDVVWRQDFMVEAGLMEEEDQALRQKIELWNNSTSRSFFNKWVLYFFAALAVGTLINWLLLLTLPSFYLFLAFFGLNLLIVMSQLKNIRREGGHLDGVSKSLLKYSRLLHLIETRKHRSTDLRELRNELRVENASAGKALHKLSRLLNGFDQLHNILAALLMNGLFHYHLHVLCDLISWKSKFGKKIPVWLDVVAGFDQRSSVANYAFNHPHYCYPQISDRPEFSASNLGHPLLAEEKRVVNSIDFTHFKYVVLTGSNMSGKSTFLRTIGVNMVLMKIGAPVCATDFKSYPFTLLSSMKLVDSLDKDESYFQAEIIRLKRIQQILQEDEPCFVLLDEILRGTNSDDKRNGTRLFMQKIASYNALGVIATHDIDIADLAQKQAEIFEACFFESRVEGEKLLFDYKLRKGICTTPNATRLMQAQGII